MFAEPCEILLKFPKPNKVFAIQFIIHSPLLSIWRQRGGGVPAGVAPANGAPPFRIADADAALLAARAATLAARGP